MRQLFIFLPIFFLLLSCAGNYDKDNEVMVRDSERGKASYYADKYQGRKTASGQRLNNSAMTAAHKTLPFGTRVRVTNIKNGKTVDVVINDRGPFVRGRVIDLARAAFVKIEDLRMGLADVEVVVR
jgi:rare lipoprotein A